LGALARYRTIRDSNVEGAALAAKYGYPWDETALGKRLPSIWEHHRLIAVENQKPRPMWRRHG